MKILFVAWESNPFVKTGGLGDVIGSLPKELQNQGIEVRVVLPKHISIPPFFKSKMALIKRLTVSLGWRRQYCGLEILEQDGITYYFLNNEYYFNREGIYGFYDDGERHAFYCRALLEALPHLDFEPDVLHCHDWHTALVSVFLKTHYREKVGYQGIKTLLTIHNLFYQGIFPKEVLGDLLSLGDEYFTQEGLEFYGKVNYLKGGLVFSDLLSTVSKSYAEEIQTPSYGEGLDGLLRKMSYKLRGIVNGIDYQEYNPATDPQIYFNYNHSTLKKQQNKVKLQEQLQLPQKKDTPMVAIVSRLVEQKGLDLVEQVLEEILAYELQLVVLGTGESSYEEIFRRAVRNNPDKVSVNLFFDDSLARKIYAASDIFLMPSLFEPCGIGQLLALRYGAIPVVRETGGLKDTVQPFNEQGEGNGFIFTNYNPGEMLEALNRALELYKNKRTWAALVRNACRRDYSWRRSAGDYVELYRSLLKE